ncbi:unnamed protein product [Angiostrongylus costaricensis]|uniref:Transposase n=1 Tax=Angiostrongylus costaricensis TaxID=334426 RepID=A0A0R3P9X7_ANGCS|nr:unnamed protein product [Angiostrongylus costaricensis]
MTANILDENRWMKTSCVNGHVVDWRSRMAKSSAVESKEKPAAQPDDSRQQAAAITDALHPSVCRQTFGHYR